MKQRYDIAVIGGGGGGFAAAWTAARLGASVVLIEKADRLGGNAVRGGVHSWEAVAGATGVPQDLYDQLRPIPGAVGVSSYGRHFLWQDPDRDSDYFPGGEMVIDPTRSYADTLRRCGTRGLAHDEARCREQWHGVVFEPDAMASAMRRVLKETGRVTLKLNTAFAGVEHDDGRVRAVQLDNGRRITAGAFIDGTADGLLCLAAGCGAHIGREARSVFNEPAAPEAGDNHVNGATLIFRVTPTDRPGVEPLPDGVPAECWWRPAFPLVSMFHYPNGDRNLNMLPTMEGREWMALGYRAALAESRRRVAAYWRYLQTHYEEFQHYRMRWVAPALGVRESRRIVCEYMLTQHDLLQGLSRQKHDDIIAIADHSMDTHGNQAQRCGELAEPYGIPLRCLIPRGFTNLYVACRAAGFSSIAASSCRLTRTMMQLGQAAAAKACGVPVEALHVGTRFQA